ncbi:uncharacterized protein LOC113856171 [Abrus precatorius]|uniref:Uncharacterized protein LOC113856171 n=1 Tax=Abrus precatorius TaxID=3816 RepID=A0A8B8KIN4_ABRPR|nr:uncharacterized protein LOC113856171 [Abrus precatorius]
MNDLPPMMAQSQILQGHQNYVVWTHPPPAPYTPENASVYPRPPAFNPHPGRVNRKGSVQNKFHRTGSGPSHGFKPANPNPNEFHLPTANRSGGKGRRFHHPKRKYGDERLDVPLAPHNTTTFLIRAKKSGGIALVSPCPMTPAITPTMLPAGELVVEMAKEQWVVDGYGSMKGLIRLRHEKNDSGENSGEDSGDVSDSVAVEKRLDHDLSRFEMIYPNSGEEQKLENRVDEQDTQIAHLEEENLTLKEKLFLMERELGELRRRVRCLETDGIGTVARDGNEAENFAGDADDCSEKSVGNDVGDSGGCNYSDSGNNGSNHDRV